jgi:hypothetical protein
MNGNVNESVVVAVLSFAVLLGVNGGFFGPHDWKATRFSLRFLTIVARSSLDRLQAQPV